MSFAGNFVLKLKRGETPLFRVLRSIVTFIVRPSAPRIPAFLKPLFRFIFEFHWGVVVFFRLLVTLVYSHPVFQGRCMRVGKNLGLSGLPFSYRPCGDLYRRQCQHWRPIRSNVRTFS